MPRVEIVDPAQLQADLTSPNPYVAATSAQMAAAIEQHAPTDIVVKLYTNTYGQAGQVSDYMSLQVAFPREEGVPTGSLILKGSDPLAELALTCETTVVPITVEIGLLRWSGRVDVAHDNFGGTDPDTVECELLHDKAWLTRILCWPNFLLPIQIQFGSLNLFGVPGIPSGGNRAVFIGPAITCIKTLIAEQAFRIQTGLWEMVNNLFSFPPNLNWEAWFGTLLMQGGLSFQDFMRALTTPIYVVPTNPLFDTSPWVSFNGRMDEILSLINETVKDNGLTVEVNLWLPGEAQPDPFAEALNLLQAPTIVVDVKDRMSITGFSGTFLDGLERDLVDLADSTFGEILAPFLNPTNEFAPEGINIAPLLGEHFVIPWCLFTDHPRGGVKGKVSHHHPLCYTVITGGKSPKWVCPPLVKAGGGQAQGLMDERPDQRHPRILDRHADDCRRLHRRTRINFRRHV